MGLTKNELTLPEWSFLDGNSQNGDTLEGRTLLLHIRSMSVIEFFSLDEVKIQLNPKTISQSFKYNNPAGITESFLAAIHLSSVFEFEQKQILEKACQYYIQYLEWEDKNIITESTSKQN